MSVLRSSLLISLLLLLGACTETAKVPNKADKKIELLNIDPLFEFKTISEEDLRNLWQPRLEAIEKIPLQNISDEKLLEVSGYCFSFSNSLNYAAKRMLAEKQKESAKILLLQFSNRITNFTRRLRDLMVKSGKVEKTEFNTEVSYSTYADTTWLTVFYNDTSLNILSLMNSIAFDDSDNIEVTKYYLSEILMRLNETVDVNIYQNIVEEIAFNNSDLVKKFNEKLQRIGGYEKFSDLPAQKFFKNIGVADRK